MFSEIKSGLRPREELLGFDPEPTDDTLTQDRPNESAVAYSAHNLRNIRHW